MDVNVRQDEAVLRAMDTIKRYCAERKCNNCVILDGSSYCMFRDGCQIPCFWRTDIKRGAAMGTPSQEQKERELEEAVYPVHKWIGRYGISCTTVVVSLNRAAVNEEHMSIALSVPGKI